MKRCSISIDLDGIACYYRIHGLGEPPAELAHAIYERAVPRAAELFARRGVHVTWFVIGRDAEHAPNAERLRALAAGGDEIGNHSYSHHYDLARMAARDVDDEITRADRVLQDIIGGKVRGFRAPGYDVSPAMLDTLARLGYRYDSSIFPAPGYYAAKAAVMGVLAALGRRSGAVMTNPRALVAPGEPYRPAMTAPWRRGQAPVVELPVAVTPVARVPAIGTSLLVLPAWLRARIVSAMARRSFWNLELHGIDFADAEQDGIPGELVERQPDLRIPIGEKLTRMDRLLDGVKASWDVATLAGVAAEAQRTV